MPWHFLSNLNLGFSLPIVIFHQFPKTIKACFSKLISFSCRWCSYPSLGILNTSNFWGDLYQNLKNLHLDPTRLPRSVPFLLRSTFWNSPQTWNNQPILVMNIGITRSLWEMQALASPQIIWIRIFFKTESPRDSHSH